MRDGGGGSTKRRRFLATTGLGLAALAGCSSGGKPGESGDGGTDGDAGDGETAGNSGGGPAAGGSNQRLASASITSDLAAQPSMGPAPMEGESVIVEVTDPSSPTCRSFHSQAFPRIESELVESGRIAYVVRTVDRVYPWAGDASAVLEAVHQREPAVCWDLLVHYFSNQSEMSTDTVLAETRAFLAETGVDGEAVTDAVGAGEYDDAVAADVEAAIEAGANGQPYFFLFVDGRLRTDFSGEQNYEAFRSSLGY